MIIAVLAQTRIVPIAAHTTVKPSPVSDKIARYICIMVNIPMQKCFENFDLSLCC